MKYNQQKLALFLVGTALTSLAWSAFGDTESYTESFGSSSAPLAIGGSNFPVTLAIPQFDTALGNLTNIQITLTTTGQLQSDVANVGAATTFVNAQAGGTISVSGSDGATCSVSLTTTPFSGSIAAGTPATATFSLGPLATLAGQGISDVPSFNIGTFEAAGSGGILDFPLNATFDGSFSGNGPSSLSFAGNASAFGSVEVEYFYVSGVPEPGELISGSFLCFAGWKALDRLRRARPGKV